MGTRALTFVYQGDTPIINMYRQFDGYPTGHGKELADFLAPFTMVKGLNKRQPQMVANGMGCLAAQLIAHFKDGAGGFYIHPVTDTECGQDYEYHVYQSTEVMPFGAGESPLRVRVTDRGFNMFGLTMSDKNEALFDGTVEEFVEFCTEKETA
jgi:hypothetical protein